MAGDFDFAGFFANAAGHHQRVTAAAVRAVDVFGEAVLKDAKQLTPVDTGFLVASGTTLPATVNGEQIDKQIGFNADYAAPVHEILTSHHPQGQAKFLETALRNAAPKFGKFIGDRVRAETGG